MRWPDEPTLHVLKQPALELGLPLEVETGSTPGWAESWSRAHLCTAHRDDQAWWTCLVDADGFVIDDPDLQPARMPAVTH